MNEILNKITTLVNESKGKYIKLAGEQYYFLQLKRYELSEIESFESLYKIKLPNEYKNFLLEIGACQLYFDEYELGIEFHELTNIKELTEEVFIGIDNPFPNLLFIASNFNNGDLIGYNLTIKSNFCLSIYSIEEEYPENWLKINKFITLSTFLENLVLSNGENYHL